MPTIYAITSTVVYTALPQTLNPAMTGTLHPPLNNKAEFCIVRSKENMKPQ